MLWNDSDLRDWSVKMATKLAYYSSDLDYPDDVEELLAEFYEHMTHLTRQSRGDLA